MIKLTDYSEISNAVQEFLQDHPKTYAECVPALKNLLRTKFKSLELETNPIIMQMKHWDKQQLEFVIIEYSGFSNEAIHMLLDAMIRDHDWQLLRNEILHNIEEERGLKTRGIPHLEMMRQGYRVDLGIETDYVNYSPVTDEFIHQMRDIFKHDDNAFSAGALLAFEGTAINEFKILDGFVRHYKSLMGEELKKGSLTNLYIDGHKDFEIGHEEDLRKSIESYINEENIHRFVKGYIAVCLTMNTWWDKLAIETYFRMLYRKTSVSDSEVFDVSQVFKS